jgi:hypothetical protein
LLAQCSYDGLFKSICQALCLYRKEADNRQDYYEELHEDRESVPDDLILVSHDDVILPIGKRKARRACGRAGLYRRILPGRLEGAGGCDQGRRVFLASIEPYSRTEDAMINKSLTIGNVRPNQNRPLMISKSGSGSGSPRRLAQTATYWRYDPIYRS